MSLLGEVGAMNFEFEILAPGSRTAMEWRVDQRSENVPDLIPAFTHRSPEIGWMLRAQDRAVGIIVNLDVLRPPPKKQGEPIGNQKAGHHAQARRPGLHWPEGRLRPVRGADEHAHIAGASRSGNNLGMRDRYVRHKWSTDWKPLEIKESAISGLAAIARKDRSRPPVPRPFGRDSAQVGSWYMPVERMPPI